MTARRELAAAALLVLAYVVAACLRLSLPGVNYDEALHVNAALGGVDDADGTFISSEVAGIPVMVMPYVGALKSWLTAPVFAAFGVSALTIRIPHVVLTALALLLLWAGARRLLGPGVALLALLVTVVDPNVVAQTRHDFGLVVLGLAAKAAALLFLARFLRDGRTRWLAALLAALAAGLFNKLDFIWFVNGFLPALLLVYGRDLRRPPGRAPGWSRSLLVLAGWLALAAAFYAVHRRVGLLAGAQVGLPAVTLDIVGGRLAEVAGMFGALLSGESFHASCYGPIDTPAGEVVAWGAAALLGAGLLLLACNPGGRVRHRRPALLLLLVLLATVAQIAVTPSATRPWHVFTAQPMLALLLAWSLVALADTLPRRAGRALAGALLAGLLLHQLATSARYHRSYERPANALWSPAIVQLVDWARETPHGVVSVDWGTHNQLLTFTQQPRKYFDVSFSLDADALPPRIAKLFVNRYLLPQIGLRFVTHPAAASHFVRSRANLFRIAGQHGLQLVLEQAIGDGTRTVYEIWRTEPAGDS